MPAPYRGRVQTGSLDRLPRVQQTRVMCNLYSQVKGQAALRATYRAMIDRTGNLPLLPGIFPDQMAPVIRNTADGRELAMLRWGFPSPPGVPGNRPVTNIRNTKSSFWRAWMKPENRVLVPATSFCEYLPGKPAVPHWFALNEERPLFAFAGLWRPWTGMRGKVEGVHDLFAFLTTDANSVVAPIHPKAMPIILTTDEECNHWMTAPIAEALELQRPLAEDLLSVVAVGARQDGLPQAETTSSFAQAAENLI
jgi:putative SOS response-associated peptidase YedK